MFLADRCLRGDLDNSRRLLESSERILKESGTHGFNDDQFEIDWLKKTIRDKEILITSPLESSVPEITA
jgi:hypothetical protein